MYEYFEEKILNGSYRLRLQDDSGSLLGTVLAHEREGLGSAAGSLLQVHGLVVLVHNLAAEDFFQNVLEAHDTRDSAELVDHAHHVPALLEEAEQQLVEHDAVGNELQGAHELPELPRRSTIPIQRSLLSP